MSDAAPLAHLYLDENVPHQLADLLSPAGIIVHLPSEVGALSAADSTHLRTCSNNKWVLVTQDRRDFRRLHWLWMTLYNWGVLPNPHSGILTIMETEPLLPEEWAPAIRDWLQRRSDLDGSMHLWQRSSREWRPEPQAFM